MADPNLSPRGWAVTVGVASAQCIPAGDNSRRKLMFHNPHGTNSVAVCPKTNGATDGDLAAVVNGAGSITILPLATFEIEGKNCQSAFNAIASGAGTPFTIWEFKGDL